MLRFFRTIRQKLIDSGSVTKYLFYAIGEILLVVIGILIALQVNNWNEESKLRLEEQFLLSELKKEFNINLGKIRKDFEGNTNSLQAVNELLEMFKIPRDQVVPERIDSLFNHLFALTSFDATTGVVNEIIGTGKLNVLQDDSLRFMLSQWSGVISDLEEDVEIRMHHFESFLIPGLVRVYPVKNSNKFIDFSFWIDRYERDQLSKSPFSFNPDHFFTQEIEGLLYIHSLNQDFVIMNDIRGEKYILELLELIERNQN